MKKSEDFNNRVMHLELDKIIEAEGFGKQVEPDE